MDPRPLTSRERDVLQALLSDDAIDDVETLRRQALEVLATAGCTCGCGTLNLHPAADAPKAQTPGTLASSALFQNADGSPGGGLLLFVNEGMLTTLEVYGYGDAPEALPPVASMNLEPYSRDRP